MARTLLTWRWAALTLVLVAAVVAMVALGGWQWERSVPAAEAEVVDLASLESAVLPDVLDVTGSVGATVPPGASGELVALTGRWRPDRTLLIADRSLGDRAGRWVVTAIELGGSDVEPTGGTDVGEAPLVPVVRGWLPAEPGEAATTVPLPSGSDTTVTLVGWVQQSEPLDLPIEVLQPDGVVPLISTADLANRWPEALVPGFVVMAPTADQVAATPLTLLPAPPEEETQTRDWRNLAYSAQWFVFAGFAVLLWWRMLRDDRDRTEVAERARTEDAEHAPSEPLDRSPS